MLQAHLFQPSIEAAFLEFHAENPDVYRELRTLAHSLKAAGRSHYGIKALYEVVRFHRALQTTDDHFKLNNNFTALYARMLMEQEPDLVGFFELRQRTAA